MIRGFCSDLPASGIARDFVSLAGMHSAPNMPSTGLALMIGSREADPIHPGLVALHGSGAVLEIPGAAPWGAASSSLTGDNCGRAVEYLRRDRSFIHLGRELGGDTAQDFTDRHPRLDFDWLRHVQQHEGSHAREVVKACQGLGNVCRA